MTVAVDTRQGATPHLGLCRNGHCNAVCVSFNLHRHSSGWLPCKPMMESYYSIDLLEEICALCRQHSRLPNHTSVRFPSWSYDLIYDIVQVWPDPYQECNTLIPHVPEQDNLGDPWQSLPCAFKCRLALTCLRTINNVRRKAGCYQNHGKEIWVRMHNIPINFLSRGHIVPTMRRTSFSSETVSDTYQRRTIWNIIVFLWYIYLPIIV